MIEAATYAGARERDLEIPATLIPAALIPAAPALMPAKWFNPLALQVKCCGPSGLVGLNQEKSLCAQ